MKFEWEIIHHNYIKKVGGSNTQRAKVIGGWLISQDVYTDALNAGNERTFTNSLCFVPDPNHEWTIE